MLTLLLIFSSRVKAQNQPLQELYNSDGVNIHADLIHCESVANGTSKEYLVLSVENQNDHAVRLSFKKDMWYNGICLSCDSESLEYAFSALVEAQSTMKGGCDTNNGLRIFSKMTELKNVRHLTHYELRQISVDEIN